MRVIWHIIIKLDFLECHYILEKLEKMVSTFCISEFRRAGWNWIFLLLETSRMHMCCAAWHLAEGAVIPMPIWIVRCPVGNE
jgi:hypothetical protein